MGKTRNVTIRLTEEDLMYFDELALECGFNRTDLIRNAVKNYRKEEKEEDNTYFEKATSVITKSKSINDFSHPLLLKIQNEGIKVHDENHKIIAEIRTLTELMNFVNTKVFNHDL